MEVAPPEDGEVVNRHDDGADYADDGGDAPLLLPLIDVTPEHQVPDVDEPQDEGGGEAGIPGPAGAPNSGSPDTSGEENNCGENDAEQGGGAVCFFLNTGERDGGGWPIFVRDQTVEVPFAKIADVQLLDLDGDGALDLVVNGHFIHNLNANGWPFTVAEPVDLGGGELPAFVDLDGDGVLEMVHLEKGKDGPFAERLVWQRQQAPLEFGAAEDLGLVAKEDRCTQVRAVEDGTRRDALPRPHP